MRQVPQVKKYTLIGSGRLASHLKHWLNLKELEFQQWSRDNNPNFNTTDLNNAINKSSHLLLAISDDSLDKFINKYKDSHTLIHFSGAYFNEQAIGAHPLMTFADSLYEDSFYDSIPFVIDQKLSLKDLITGFENPHHYIEPKLKPLYHSYCTMSGNFTQILWQSVFENFNNNLNIPSEVLLPFMEKTFQNLQISEQALTGPFVRGDSTTINKHLQALSNTREHRLYQSFLEFYTQTNQNTKTQQLTKEL